MLASAHILAGAAIGKSVRPFRLAILVALASHFLLDFIPHMDFHGLFGIAHGGPTRAEVIGTLGDVTLGVVLVLWAIRGLPARRAIIWAAFAGVALDLVDNVPPWGPHFQAWVGTAWLSKFHHGLQHNLPRSEWPLSLTTWLVVMVIALIVLRRD